ncbi:TM2 domain-containing protein 2-like isoform X2 [Homarus americanus]|uniref:TM2 domain-containing protein 2-like isoform X2 n=1 Tax=Homarus americanus TaxID=6706 RepID=UPI001C44C9D5|nr:TM2 domain-containing protein 2-like isoform X2 [Homarus americanus]
MSVYHHSHTMHGVFTILLLLSAVSFIPSKILAEPPRPSEDLSSSEICIPHSPKVNCSFLPLEFLECEKPTDHRGNESARDDEGYGCVKFGGQRFEDVEITKVWCSVLDGIDCCGERRFLRDGFPCIKHGPLLSWANWNCRRKASHNGWCWHLVDC